LIATASQSGSGGCTTANANPSTVAMTIGLPNRLRNFAWWSMIQTPSVKCSRFEMVKSATMGEKPAPPYASTASGSPMLPQLLNIIGGTNVRGLRCISFANGHASSPDPSTTPTLPTISQRLAARSKSLLASAENTSAGASTFMLMRFTTVMSGLARRA
jgi:hypothetical protein